MRVYPRRRVEYAGVQAGQPERLLGGVEGGTSHHNLRYS